MVHKLCRHQLGEFIGLCWYLLGSLTMTDEAVLLPHDQYMLGLAHHIGSSIYGMIQDIL